MRSRACIAFMVFLMVTVLCRPCIAEDRWSLDDPEISVPYGSPVIVRATIHEPASIWYIGLDVAAGPSYSAYKIVQGEFSEPGFLPTKDQSFVFAKLYSREAQIGQTYEYTGTITWWAPSKPDGTYGIVTEKHILHVTVVEPYCGDGIVRGDEQCDDGNRESDDGCSDTCREEYCGDGVLNGDEECDGDAGIGEFQKCTESCTIEEIPHEACSGVILDHVIAAPTVAVTLSTDEVDAGEEFRVVVSGSSEVCLASVWWYASGGSRIKPGSVNGVAKNLGAAQNFGAGNGSTEFTNIPGDRVIFDEPGEYRICANSRDVLYPIPGEAHQASEGEGIVCSPITVRAPNRCGNGVIDSGEACDGDAGVGLHQECSSDCTLIDLAFCGDGIVNGNEQCDGLYGIGLNQLCTPSCTLMTLPHCGDGVVNNNETCDGTAGVGEHQACSPYCALIDLPYCGDGVVNNSEECDGLAGVGEDQTCSGQCLLVSVAKPEKVTICHHSDKGANTITISKSALAAHLAHGDTLGACVDPEPENEPAAEDRDKGKNKVKEEKVKEEKVKEDKVKEDKEQGKEEKEQAGSPENEKVTLCHRTGNGKKAKEVTIVVSANAVDAHLAHGDSLGACGEEPEPEPYCGDGTVDAGEACDGTAGVGEHQECSAACELVDLRYCPDSAEYTKRTRYGPVPEILDQTGNLIANGNFETGTHLPWKSWDWPTVNASTNVSVDGEFSVFIDTTSGGRPEQNIFSNIGLFQYPSGLPMDTYTASAWFYPVCGQSRLGLSTGDGHGTVTPPTSTLNGWVYLEVTAVKDGGPLLYGWDNYSQFYVDGVWVNRGAVNLSPYAPQNGFRDPNLQYAPHCGDGMVNNNEQCDGEIIQSCNVSGYVGTVSCQPDCTLSQCHLLERCGDGRVQDIAGEECDDGNTSAGDGCSGTCVLEFCGDGIINIVGEECDDGNAAEGDGCSDLCKEEYCGDGTVQPDLKEECDDGNNASNDGCSEACLDEACKAIDLHHWAIESISSSEFNDYGLDIHDNKVVWHGYTTATGSNYSADSAQIFYYDGETTHQLTDNGLWNLFPKISSEGIVWSANAPSSDDGDVNYYDFDEIHVLAHGSVSRDNVDIHENRIIWSNSSGGQLWESDGEHSWMIDGAFGFRPRVSSGGVLFTNGEAYSNHVYLYDGEDIQDLGETTDSDAQSGNHRGQIDGDRVTWFKNSGVYRENEVMLKDLKTGIATQITDGNIQYGQPSQPVVSGQYVAWFDMGIGGIQPIHLYNGQDTITIAETDSASNLCFGDGFLAWSMARNGQWDLFVYNLETGETIQITNDVNIEGNIVASGRYMAYLSMPPNFMDEGGHSEVRLVSFDVLCGDSSVSE